MKDENSKDEKINGPLEISPDRFQPQKNEDGEEEKNDQYFRCEICIVWLDDMDEFFAHVTEEHPHLEVSDDIQNILYDQWEKILKIERTITELISKSKFKSAKRHLKSSLVTLNGIVTNIFSSNDNIFKYFVSSMRPRLKSLIKNAKATNKNDRSDESPSSKRIKKRKRKRANLENGYSSGFSSEDNLCLKEAVKRSNTKADVELKKVTYYVIPEKNNREALNFMERGWIRSAFRDILKKKYVDMDSFEDIILKRFDLEEDEIVPDDALLVKEWILDDKKESKWDEISMQNFLSKNYSKIRKKHANMPDIDSATGCEVCAVSFKSEQEYKLHMINIHHVGEFTCGKCGEILPDKEKLFEHSQQHQECDICRIGFDSWEKKEEHAAGHRTDDEWLCLVCSEKFQFVDKLKMHYASNHPVENSKESGKMRKYSVNSAEAPKCHQCGRKFTSIGRLMQHVSVVHEGKAFARKKKSAENDDEIVHEVSA